MSQNINNDAQAVKNTLRELIKKLPIELPDDFDQESLIDELAQEYSGKNLDLLSTLVERLVSVSGIGNVPGKIAELEKVVDGFRKHYSELNKSYKDLSKDQQSREDKLKDLAASSAKREDQLASLLSAAQEREDAYKSELKARDDLLKSYQAELQKAQKRESTLEGKVDGLSKTLSEYQSKVDQALNDFQAVAKALPDQINSIFDDRVGKLAEGINTFLKRTKTLGDDIANLQSAANNVGEIADEMTELNIEIGKSTRAIQDVVLASNEVVERAEKHATNVVDELNRMQVEARRMFTAMRDEGVAGITKQVSLNLDAVDEIKKVATSNIDTVITAHKSELRRVIQAFENQCADQTEAILGTAQDVLARKTDTDSVSEGVSIEKLNALLDALSDSQKEQSDLSSVAADIARINEQLQNLTDVLAGFAPEPQQKK